MSALPNILDEMEQDYELAAELRQLRKGGGLIKLKARMLVEAVALPRIFQIIENPNVPDSLKLEFMRFLVKLGDLEPKADTFAGVAGGQFGVIINLPGAGGPGAGPTTSTLMPAPSQAIDVTPTKPFSMALELPLGPRPAYLSAMAHLEGTL